MGFRPFPAVFFNRSADQVAPDLLGATIVSSFGGGRTTGRIVETEAYLGEVDPASHGFKRRQNAQNQALYGRPGDWYVYLSYGIHWCANLVCGPKGHGSAVLLRAVEPLTGLDLMGTRRHGVKPERLCNGPGKLCQAMAITRELDGRSMRESLVRVGRPTEGRPLQVEVSLRIGITKAADWPLRYSETGSRWRSRP
ncbi:MAG: DNA-3-methyladenine glycosylase [Gemmatimonadota bacterium]